MSSLQNQSFQTPQLLTTATQKGGALPYGINFTIPLIPLSITKNVKGCKVKLPNGSTKVESGLMLAWVI